MLVKKKTSPQKLIILVLLIVCIVGLTIFLLMKNFYPNGFFGKVQVREAKKMETVIRRPESGMSRLPAYLEKKDYLDSKEFKSLEVYGNVPIKVRAKGKENPFLFKD